MMLPLLSIAYLPPIAWCAVAWQNDAVAIEAHENYQKGSLRNRCHIAGPNGVQRLSIPLAKGKHQQTPIRDVRIAYDEPWQRHHWRSIQTAYGNAPFFEHYADHIAPFYERRYAFLFDYNLELLTFVLQKKFGWAGNFQFSETFFSPHQWPHGTDLRRLVLAEPAGGTSWLSPARYPQVFEERSGFLPNLSVLDLLFCCGKRGGEVLTETTINHSLGFGA
ncbi:MAG: WbqC family protein [Saprospiraceae bacterium]|nr:WbqC family protein [Saprospiraceae bacterium]